jgi:hypothetical protein
VFGLTIIVQLPNFDRIVDYLNYDECCALRDTCRYIHDLTSAQRRCWKLRPMRGAIMQHAIHIFLKYARLHNGLSCLESGFHLSDEGGDVVCKRHLELK